MIFSLPIQGYDMSSFTEAFFYVIYKILILKKSYDFLDKFIFSHFVVLVVVMNGIFYHFNV